MKAMIIESVKGSILNEDIPEGFTEINFPMTKEGTEDGIKFAENRVVQIRKIDEQYIGWTDEVSQSIGLALNDVGHMQTAIDTQVKIIHNQKNEISHFIRISNATYDELRYLELKIANASLWQRIKYVFTGRVAK